jgi:hypothetical protein
VKQLSDAFEQLPTEMQAEAWAQMRLRVALEAWGGDAESTPVETD